MLTFINTNDYKESIALHQNLLPRARKKGDKRREVVHYNSIGNAYYSLGSLDEALLYFQKDYDLSAEIGDKVGVATTLSSMSNVHKQKGDFDKATDLMRRGMDMHKEAGDASGEAVACVNLAGVLWEKAEAMRSRLSSLEGELREAQRAVYGTILQLDNAKLVAAKADGDTEQAVEEEAVAALEKSVDEAERGEETLQRSVEEYEHLRTEAIGTYKRGLRLVQRADAFLQSAAESANASFVKEAKFKALCDLSIIEISHLFRTHTAADFRASAHRAREELDQIEARLRSALEFEQDHRVVLRNLACVAYARGDDEEVLDLMRQCFDLEMSMSRGRLASCQYCGQLRGDNAEMLTCGSCRVSRYCCAEHQRMAWSLPVRNTPRHKRLCPLLKEWRLISKGQGSQDALNPAVLQHIEQICGFKEEDSDEEEWETEEDWETEDGEDQEEEEEEEQAAVPEEKRKIFKEASGQVLQSRKIVKTRRSPAADDAAGAVCTPDVAPARRESAAATVAQEPQRREQHERANNTQTQKQSSEKEGAGAPASADAAGSGAAYEYGDVVTVVGLQSKPQHNGKVAKVLDRQKDRFQVQIQDEAMASMALRPTNLEPEFLAQGSLPFHTFVRDLDTLFDDMRQGAPGGDEQVLTREVQALRLARVLEHASEEQARQLSSNLNALGVPVMVGAAHRQSLSSYFSAGAEDASSSASNVGGATTVKVEDAVALTRIFAIGMYKKIGFALVDYPPGVGQKARSLTLMEKALALSEKVSKDLVADALLTLIGVKFSLRDYAGGLELLHRHHDAVQGVADSSFRNEITSKLALTCLHSAERAAKETANGVTGIAKLILKLFRAGAQLAGECGDAMTRGWCLSGQGWMTTVSGDGSDTQLLKSLELYKEAHDILLPLNEPGDLQAQMRLINSLGLTANMHRDLSLRAAKAGDRGEVPQQYHATAVQLIGQAAQRASILLSEALNSRQEIALSTAAERLGTTLRCYVGWYYLGRDEVVRCGQVPTLDWGDTYSLTGTVDPSDARLVLLQEVLARLGDVKKAIQKAQHKDNIAKECSKLLAAYKAVGSLHSAALEDVAEREVAQTKEMRDVLNALHHT